MEYKQLRLDAADVKFDDEARTVEGYASVFGGIDSYGDTIAKGAYEGTLQDRQRPVRMRWNHFGPVIGKWLEMREDEHGLYVKGTLTPGHSVANDVYASLKHGAVDGLSIGFIPKAYEIDEENETRTLTEIELIEISVVEEPADLGARIEDVKNLQERIATIDTLKDAESCLRDACGVSRSAAKALVSQIKTLVEKPKRDSGDAVEATLNWRLYKTLKLQNH